MLTDNSADNVLPVATAEVDARAFVLLCVWHVEMRQTAAAGVTDFSTIVLLPFSWEKLLMTTLYKSEKGLFHQPLY